MVRIAVCDDDKNVTNTLSRYLKQKRNQFQGVELDVAVYHSGEDFLRDIGAGVVFHIVFMDIEMEGINGVEVGQALRNTLDGDDIILIYISSHDSYFEGIVQVGVFRFIKKPIASEKFDDVFDRALTLVLRDKPKLFQFKVGTEIRSIKLDKLVYLKNNKKLIEIYAWDEMEKSVYLFEKFYSTMDEALDKLPKGQFLQCARSIIVNIDYVQGMGRTFFTLADKCKTEIPIGKTYKEVAKDTYFGRRARYL